MASNKELIDKLVEKVTDFIDSKPFANTLKDDAQRNLRAVVQSVFSQMDVVSRDEFDAQVAVLHRSREKIEMLEKQLAEINHQIS